MSHYDIDVGCTDCGEYLYSYLYTSDRLRGPQYCEACQREHDTPMEHFIRQGERDAEERKR
jgi:hypothetical protein